MSELAALARIIPTLALIVGALLLVRRWAQRGGALGANDGVKVLSRTGLTRGSVLAIVEVAGHRYLLGASDQGVRLLTELDDDAMLSTPAPPAPPRAMDRRAIAQGPRMGLVNRLQQMTVRSHPSRPSDVIDL
jgi:flagellar biogenesis protein FliO